MSGLIRLSFFIIFISSPFICAAQKSADTLNISEIDTKSEKFVDKDLSLELGSAKVKLISKRKVQLMSAPGDSGIVTGEIKKGVQVQQIDIIGDHYLICYMGRCGYIHKDSLLKISEEKMLTEKKEKLKKDSISVKI